MRERSRGLNTPAPLRPVVTVYETADPTSYREIDRWEDGVGWLAHPDEAIARASHAVATDDGVWVLDPLDAPGVDDLLAGVGEVAGVAVCSSWHARDAGVVARRHGVEVWIPEWMGRVEDRVDAPVRRYDGALGDTGFSVRRHAPLPSWQEAILYREDDATLYAPESLGTSTTFVVGDEPLGVAIYLRAIPPRSVLADRSPERVLVGHGTGVFEDADRALTEALATARQRAPRAVVENGITAVGQLLAAARN